VVLAWGCGSEPGTDLLPTADPYARGYTDDDFPRVQEVAPGVYTYEQLRSAGEERFTTVSMFVVSDEGVLVADGQGSVEETRRLVENIASITDRPITHVVIGSDHGDHTGGNAAFPDGALFIAHPTSAASLRNAAAAGNAPEIPIVEAPRGMELDLGGRAVRILFLGRAHTGGDLVVHLPDDGVAFMSEAYLHRVFPAMRSAYPSEWVDMIEAAQALEAEVYIPGHGFVDPPEVLRRELEIFRQALEAVIAEGRRLHAAGVPMEEARESANFGWLEDWSLRDSQGPRAIQQVFAELDGRLPPPS
jgi:glyoxylase-like metal-dependent hydrolase (beta-lactamase superfamily II)